MRLAAVRRQVDKVVVSQIAWIEVDRDLVALSTKSLRQGSHVAPAEQDCSATPDGPPVRRDIELCRVNGDSSWCEATHLIANECEAGLK